MIEIIGIVFMVAITVAGIFLQFLGMPGNFAIFFGGVIAFAMTGWHEVTLLTILLLFGIVLAGEVIDFFLGAFLARKKGVSRAGMWGGIIGGVLGALVGLPFPVLGNIIGAFVGAFLGSVYLELVVKGKLQEALKAGSFVLVGRILSGSLKIGIGLGVSIYVIISII